MELKRIVKYEAERDPAFAAWIGRTVGGENLRECLQCGLCSGNCPLSLYMDFTPRRLMQLSREGFKEQALSSIAIWLCTSCYACVVDCPKRINITHVMYALKRRAIEEGHYPKRFPIAVMAREFSRMVRSRGRITESWLILRVFLQTAILRLFGMSDLGRRMLLTGRMPLWPDHIERRKDIATLIDNVTLTREELAL